MKRVLFSTTLAEDKRYTVYSYRCIIFAKSLGTLTACSESRKSHDSTALNRRKILLFYDVFEGGFEICMNNPVSVKFLHNATSTVKGIAHLQ